VQIETEQVNTDPVLDLSYMDVGLRLPTGDYIQFKQLVMDGLATLRSSKQHVIIGKK